MSAPLVILLFAAVIAVGSAIVAFRVVHRDRQRGAARVAALANAIDAGVEVVQPRDEHAVRVASLFESRHREGGRVWRLAAGAAAAMAIVGVVFILSGRRNGESESRPQETGAAPTPMASAPLELVSMRHERHGNKFVVTGFVRNPAAGSPVSELTAVVSAFDRDGTRIASGRAPIDFATLEPGDGSPFVVNISTRASVSRYRVAFRHGDTVVRHLDRRGEPVSLASNRP